jgi:ribosome-associated heat shock protein Hsp15
MRRLETAPEAMSLRLDKWLWFARLAKTRSLAAKLCQDGKIAVGHTAAAKPHHPVRVGDAISFDGPVRRRFIVRALGDRRGPAVEARLLYDEPEPPVRIAAAPWTSLFDEESVTEPQ